MKIAPVSINVKNLGISNNFNYKKSNYNSNNSNSPVVSYFDIPFTSIIKKDGLYTRAKKAVISEIKAEKEVEDINQHAFLLMGDAQAKINDVVDKIQRAQKSGFLAYHDDDGNLVRSFKFGGKKITSMKEYENGNKILKAKVFDDGSIKIHDYKSGEVIFADSDYKLTSFEKTSKDTDGASVTEKIFADDSRIKYTHIKKQLDKPAVENSFVYFNSHNDNKTNLIFYKNIVGKQEFKPKNCEYVISFQRDRNASSPFSAILYLKDLKLSSTGKNYSAKSGLFYTFDGVVQNSKDICPGVISNEPVTYNENIKLPQNFDFVRGANIESEIVMMYRNGNFSKLPF